MKTVSGTTRPPSEEYSEGGRIASVSFPLDIV